MNKMPTLDPALKAALAMAPEKRRKSGNTKAPKFKGRAQGVAIRER